MRALEFDRQAVALRRSEGDQDGLLEALVNYAAHLGDAQRTADALPVLREATALADTMDRPAPAGHAHLDLARTMLVLGDGPGARREAERGLEIHRRGDRPAYQIYALATTATVSVQVGDLVHAEALLDEGRKVCGDDTRACADIALAQGTLRLAQGRVDEAERAARAALEGYETLPNGRPAALSLLARALLDQGRIPEASSTIDQALAGGVVVGRFDSELVRARVLVAQRRFGEARSLLAALVGQARTDGRGGQRLAAELVLGDLELASGKAAAGRTRLWRVEREAELHGYALLAGDARRLLARR